MSDDTYFKALALGEVQILLPRSHGRPKPIKFSRRRPVPPHPDPESQRVDISKPPTSRESRASCRVCASTWGIAVRSERHTTSAACGQPRVVHERTSSLPSSTEGAQAKLTVAITIAAGHARSATRAGGDRKVANTNTVKSECTDLMQVGTLRAGLVLPPSPTRHRRPRGRQETVEAAPESSRRGVMHR